MARVRPAASRSRGAVQLQSCSSVLGRSLASAGGCPAPRAAGRRPGHFYPDSNILTRLVLPEANYRESLNTNHEVKVGRTSLGAGSTTLRLECSLGLRLCTFQSQSCKVPSGWSPKQWKTLASKRPVSASVSESPGLTSETSSWLGAFRRAAKSFGL